MHLSRELFTANMYEECVDEASFLYQQRKILLAEGNLTNVELGRLERRLDAFIEALVNGGGIAANLCLNLLHQKEEGILYTVTRVLIRLGMREQLAALLISLDAHSQTQAAVIRDGLCHEIHEEELLLPEYLLPSAPSEATRLLSIALGYRRQGGGEWVLTQLNQALSTDSLQGSSEYAWALGRLWPPGTETLLQRCLEAENMALRLEAVLAILRRGQAHTLSSLLNHKTFPSWACLAVGLSGSSSARPRLQMFAASEENAVEAILALGLLGDASAVPALIEALAHPSYAYVSAEALTLLTGAGLFERIEEPSMHDEAELFDGEQIIHPWMTKATSGVVRTRSSRNPVEWRQWWNDYQSRLPPSRVRSGRLCSPAQLLVTLGSGVGENRLRQLLADELVIRYGLDMGFETNTFLSEQTRALKRGQTWIANQGQNFEQGQWYLGGSLSS